jgi:hypothetical protein
VPEVHRSYRVVAAPRVRRSTTPHRSLPLGTGASPARTATLHTTVGHWAGQEESGFLRRTRAALTAPPPPPPPFPPAGVRASQAGLVGAAVASHTQRPPLLGGEPALESVRHGQGRGATATATHLVQAWGSPSTPRRDGDSGGKSAAAVGAVHPHSPPRAVHPSEAGAAATGAESAAALRAELKEVSVYSRCLVHGIDDDKH